MVRLREISRTAVFAWLPGKGTPLLVTGTRAGAVNDDFSSDVKVEVWELGLEQLGANAEVTLAGSLTTDSGFNDIAWSLPTEEHPLGVIAGALENGSVDLWDAAKLRAGDKGALISRTSKHNGPARALQFNPHRHNLLASVGAKGEIFIYDLANMANPFKLGGAVARADDIESLDWNKQEKTAHILATGSSGGFVTVWDVKQKKDILTLNNQGRKAVSAVAWDPEESTKLATATPNDQEPTIFLWSLRNSSAPEKVLKGHELGVLSLAWCQQDPELLLSCGKDNRTICWNPRTGERLGEFTAGSNWAFETRWNPHNPTIIASASFDGKILVTSIQSTNASNDDASTASQTLDDSDFFAKAQSQPQTISFSVAKAPRWAQRPCSVAFGFGGKLVRVGLVDKKSKVIIDTFAVSDTIGKTAAEFQEKLKANKLADIVEAKIENASTSGEKADWQVIETLNAGGSRKRLREYLGFSGETDASKPASNGTAQKKAGTEDDVLRNGEVNGGADDNDDDDDDDDAFLAKLGATTGTKSNSPFSILSDTESTADKSITQALLLGQFEKALDVCLKEDRLSDAFMIAVCGGQACIDKAQAAYLKKTTDQPAYIRILASISRKNLWDIVQNASIKDWKEVMATLCTYADETEFPDLCDALGDRLEEAYQAEPDNKELRQDASFCYLAGSKLDKIIVNWAEEAKEREADAGQKSEDENAFAIHARALQDLIEKISIFRQVTNFQDAELDASDNFRLASLYKMYAEYAEILAAHGQLDVAEYYLALLPSKFDGADNAQLRVRQSTKKAAVSKQPAAAQRTAARTVPVASPFAPAAPALNQAIPPSPFGPVGAPANQYVPAGPYAPSAGNINTFQPLGYQPPTQHQLYGQSGYNTYQPPQQNAPIPPPPRAGTTSPSQGPPSAQQNMKDWNDMPEDFIKQRQPASRRGTPGPGPATVQSPFPNAQPLSSPGPFPGPPQTPYGANKPTPPLPPPPKAGQPHPPPSPAIQPPPINRATSSIANAYAPPQGSQSSTLPAPTPPPVNRGASPYQPPPSTSAAAPTSRYTPAAGTIPTQVPGQPPQRNIAPNPYSAQSQSPYAPPQQQQQQSQFGAPPPTRPPQGPPRAQAQAAPLAPPPKGPPRSGGTPAAPTPVTTPGPDTTRPRFPRGDRSHIPASAQPIVDLLSPEIARIKSVAPQAFKPQVDDMDKRINILFDHLNNGDLLQQDTVQQMVEISQAVHGKDWDRAQSLFTALQTEKAETEGTHWMVG